ncbi:MULTISPECIES: helix-turn-helix domain-containing protein [unclassified Microbacterium]|uniref:helix-turn-helix domain-containing protein n=1 Tax=unclassified Microbacterium TaxID=2609290 RepID=UPI0030172DD0
MASQAATPGQALKALRGMAGMTLKEVASEATTSIAYLSRVENDAVVPAQEYVAKVSYVISRKMIARTRAAAA